MGQMGPTPEEQRALGQQSKGSGSHPPSQALGIIDYSLNPFAYQNFKQPAPPANKVISKIKILSSPLPAAYPFSSVICLLAISLLIREEEQ